MSRKAPSKAKAAGGKPRKTSTRTRSTRPGKGSGEKTETALVPVATPIGARGEVSAPVHDAPAALVAALPSKPFDPVLADAPDRPIPPVLRQVVTNDVTTEKQAEIMGHNPRGVMRYADETTAFKRTM